MALRTPTNKRQPLARGWIRRTGVRVGIGHGSPCLDWIDQLRARERAGAGVHRRPGPRCPLPPAREGLGGPHPEPQGVGEAGKEVDADDIQLGFEVRKGRYVTFEKGEVDELRPDSTRSIEVTDFVALADVDPIYYDRTYWLGREVTRGRSPTSCCSLRWRTASGSPSAPWSCATSSTSRRSGRSTASWPCPRCASPTRWWTGRTSTGCRHGAPSRRRRPSSWPTQIVDSLAGDWKPEQYHDTYAEELRKRIVAKDKAKGNGGEDGAGPRARAEVVDLMAALEASVLGGDDRRQCQPWPGGGVQGHRPPTSDAHDADGDQHRTRDRCTTERRPTAIAGHAVGLVEPTPPVHLRPQARATLRRWDRRPGPR